jgi:hypothetical protein
MRKSARLQSRSQGRHHIEGEKAPLQIATGKNWRNIAELSTYM